MDKARTTGLKEHSGLYTSRIRVQPTSQFTEDTAFSEAAPAERVVLKHLWRSGMLALAALLLATGGAQGQSAFKAWQNIGVSVTQTVSVTATATGVVDKVEVLTGGVSGLEFNQGSGTVANPCGPGFSTPGTCNVSVVFTPAYPGLRLGAVELRNASGQVLGTAYLSGVGLGGLDVLSPGNQIEIAGKWKVAGGPINGGPAVDSELTQPTSVALDGAGNVYIADSANNQVRMVCFSAGSATIKGVTCTHAGYIVAVAGTGGTVFEGDNGPALAATLNAPAGLALDGAGNLYIADTLNNRIRKVTAATGIIATVAGDGTQGYKGDGLSATAAELHRPWGVTVDAAGNLYIADTYNQAIRRVDAGNGIITTAAGNGKPSGLGDGAGTYSGDNGPANAAGLSVPYAVAFDVYGAMYIPDSGNNRIRVVNPRTTGGILTASSIISTYIGATPVDPPCSGGLTSNATLNTPEGVAIDAASNVYIADTGDQCIRKANVTSTQIVTLAQTNDYAITLDNVADRTQVFEPVGIALDGLGNVYYADRYFMLIDEIQSDRAVLDYEATPVRQGDLSLSPFPTQVVENDGNASDTRVADVNVSSDITGIAPDLNAEVDAASTTCNPLPYTQLTQDVDCSIGAIFAPSIKIDPKTLPGTVIGNIDVANDTVNKLLDIVLVGNATAVNSTSIALTASPSPGEFGNWITLTATVTTGTTTGALTGTVTFSDTFNGVTTQLGFPAQVTAGVATFSTYKLAVGVHTLSAVYNGDLTHLKSQTPATAAETIYEGTQTTLAAVPASPSTLGQHVTFTAQVTLPNGGGEALDGSVTFTDSLATFSNNTVAIKKGVATYTSAALVQGVNVISAAYEPNTANLIHGSVGTLDQDAVAAANVSVASAPNPSIYGSPVTFTVSVPDSNAIAATGTVNIVIVPAGATTPTYPITATLSGNPATGTASLSTLPVGRYNATATYEGDTNFAKATGALATPQVVNQVGTTTTAAATPDPGIAGKPVAINATVKANSGTITPTGTVTFTDTFNGTPTVLGAEAIALTESGTAAVSSTLAPGTHSILVAYSGSADDAKSSFTLSLTVIQATTSAVVTAAPSPVTVEGTVTFSATVTGNGGTPTGAVRFLANGSTALGAANLDATGKATVTNATLAAGSYQITAVYAGDADDTGSTSPAITEVVGLIPTATGLTTASTKGASSQTILVATVENSNASGPSPTGKVTFKSGTTVIGAGTLDASGATTLTPNLNPGKYSIVAYYAGDSLHGVSQSKPASVTGQGSSFTITATPASVTVAATQNVNTAVSLTSISGFADTISLGCASLPVGVNCHFGSNSVSLGANGTVTTQLTIDTNNPLGGGAAAMNRTSGERKVEVAGLLLPFSLFLGWTLWRFRKRHATAWSVVLILALSGAAMLATGCSGFTQNSAAPGAYTIQLVGVGSNSNVTQYQDVTLTITK